MLEVNLHRQKDKAVGFESFWSVQLDGKNAQKTSDLLLLLQSDPHMQGELLSLRFKDGKGGGCLASGALLEIKFAGNDSKKVDVYLAVDKWRSW